MFPDGGKFGSFRAVIDACLTTGFPVRFRPHVSVLVLPAPERKSRSLRRLRPFRFQQRQRLSRRIVRSLRTVSQIRFRSPSDYAHRSRIHICVLYLVSPFDFPSIHIERHRIHLSHRHIRTYYRFSLFRHRKVRLPRCICRLVRIIQLRLSVRYIYVRRRIFQLCALILFVSEIPEYQRQLRTIGVMITQQFIYVRICKSRPRKNIPVSAVSVRRIIQRLLRNPADLFKYVSLLPLHRVPALLKSVIVYVFDVVQIDLFQHPQLLHPKRIQLFHRLRKFYSLHRRDSPAAV